MTSQFRILLFFLLFGSFSCFFSSGFAAKSNVYVGAYLNDITNFDLKEGRFKADLKVWCKWLGDENVPPIEFANGEITKQQEIKRERDGEWNSVIWRIQGTFRGTFPLQKFPFDSQDLNIQIDLPESEGMLLPDLAGSGMPEQFSITGWLYKPQFKARIAPKTYFSDFGSIVMEGQPFKANTVTLTVHMRRPLAGLLAKYILPLIIILCVAIGVLFVPIDQLTVRAGLSANTLVACVAFHFSLSTRIPDVSYLVIADKMFILAYFIVLCCILTVISSFLISKKNESLAQKLVKVMSIALPSMIIGFAIWQAIIVNKTEKEPPPAPVELVERPENAQDTFTLAMVYLRSLNTAGMQTDLFHRGLYHKIENGERVPHLLKELPSMTNDLVSFLPNGGMTVRWELKPDVLWGDSVPITQDDLLFSLNMMEDPNRDSVRLIENGIEILYSRRLNNVLDEFPLFPKHQFEAVFDSGGMDSVNWVLQNNPPPMDGPYMLDTFAVNEYALFKRNPYFAGNMPNIPYIRVQTLPEGSSTLEWAADNGFDGISYLSSKSYDGLNQIPSYTTKVEPSHRLAYFQPDVTMAPYNIKEVRQAMGYAIDREKLNKNLDGGMGETAHSFRSPIAEDMWDGDTLFGYNPEKARALLRQAGFRDRVPIKIMSFNRGGDYPEAVTLRGIKADLEKVGFQVELVTVKSAWSLQKQGNWGGVIYRTGTVSASSLGILWNVKYNPDRSEHVLDEPYGLFTEDIFNMTDRYKATLFGERRIAISHQIQEAYMEELPTIPLLIMSERSAYNKNLSGWNHMAGESTWWNVEEWYFANPDSTEEAEPTELQEMQ